MQKRPEIVIRWEEVKSYAHRRGARQSFNPATEEKRKSPAHQLHE